MKKQIIWIFCEIVLMVATIFISIPIWQGFSARMPAISESTLNNELMLSADGPVSLAVIDERELPIKPITIKIDNYKNKAVTGRLLLKYDKESTLDYDYIKIRIGAEVFNLSSAFMDADETYYIFDLTTVKLSKKSSQELEIALWVESNPSADIYNKDYDYDLLIVSL